MTTPNELGRSEIRELRDHYRSGQSDLGKDFFVPCLKHCTKYRRAVGYFSSTTLATWAEVLPRLCKPGGVFVQLLISPNLSDQDCTALAKAVDQGERIKLREKVADKIIAETLEVLEKSDSLAATKQCVELLAWMVANERLEIKFAFPKHVHDPGIFHEKIGVFYFPWNEYIAFQGSANETDHGYRRNYESIDVYRSWVDADSQRALTKVNQFNEAWEGLAAGLEACPLSKKSLEAVRRVAPNKQPKPFQLTPAVSDDQKETQRWRHQDEAVKEFLKAKRGVLEMATGTGKTRTAIKILKTLVDKNEIDGIIICTDGTDLLDQWGKELDAWSLTLSPPYQVLRHYGTNHELGEFALNSKNRILLVSRGGLAKLFKRLDKSTMRSIAIVHDEVHGLGSPSCVKELAGTHATCVYRLGLSATPEREYDEEGTTFIKKEIGSVIYKFSLEDAIKRGILCEFDYIPLGYSLTVDDKMRLQNVRKKEAARKSAGNPMSDEEIWIEISRVYKTAEQKPAVFGDYVRQMPSILKNTIIFVEEKEYGDQLLPLLQTYTHLYRTYYAEDDRQDLVEFANGMIDCLITCHRISQGIDIKRLNNVVLFSSASAKLETIQRIGRCLRINPDNLQKRATIIDFVLKAQKGADGIDSKRCRWLQRLSLVRKEGE